MQRRQRNHQINKVSKYLEHDHARCDRLYVRAVACVAERDREQAALRFPEFADALRLHMEMEELVIYPAFEEVPGTTAGPTLTMRAEHQQLCEVLHRLTEAIKQAGRLKPRDSLTNASRHLQRDAATARFHHGHHQRLVRFRFASRPHAHAANLQHYHGTQFALNQPSSTGFRAIFPEETA